MPRGSVFKALGQSGVTILEETIGNFLANMLSTEAQNGLDEWRKKKSEESGGAVSSREELREIAKLAAVEAARAVKKEARSKEELKLKAKQFDQLLVGLPEDRSEILRRFRLAESRGEGHHFMAVLCRLADPTGKESAVEAIKLLNQMSDDDFWTLFDMTDIGSVRGGIAERFRGAGDSFAGICENVWPALKGFDDFLTRVFTPLNEGAKNLPGADTGRPRLPWQKRAAS